MRIFIDMGHPAHVHFFRNAIHILLEAGHDVLVTANDKDVIRDLLNAYSLSYVPRGRYRRQMLEKVLFLPRNTMTIARIARDFEAEIMAGINNPYVAQAAKLLSCPSIIFDDTEWARWINVTTLPFASLICTPTGFKLDLGKRHVRYDGFHELAYVHPKYYSPDPSIPSRLKPDGRPYVIVRLISWTASHDRAVAESPLSYALRNGGLNRLSELAKVWVIGEGNIPRDLHEAAYPLHPSTAIDALAGSAGYLGEGATMAMEAALLGKPSVFVSRLRFGGIDSIERQFRLIETIASPAIAVERIEDELIAGAATSQERDNQRAKMLRSTVDVTRLIVSLLSNPTLVTRLARGERDEAILRGLFLAS